MAFYKVIVLSMEAAADVAVHADAKVQLRVSRNPDVFQDIRNGHRTVVLGAAEAYSDFIGLVPPPFEVTVRDSG